jgi:hypothetical protein
MNTLHVQHYSFGGIFKVVNASEFILNWNWPVNCIPYMRNRNESFVGKYERKGSLRIHRLRREIKVITTLRGTGFEIVE